MTIISTNYDNRGFTRENRTKNNTMYILILDYNIGSVVSIDLTEKEVHNG